MILHPSLASANPLHYGRELTALAHLDFGSLHLHIEDSSFINNSTSGMKTEQTVARQTPPPVSFHFILARPQRWLNALAELRPPWTFAPAVTLDHPPATLTRLRHTGA
ncbi:hypothetical protein Q2378_27275 [Escherichia coli]|nr:hypothetical protein [Escherichia coli]